MEDLTTMNDSKGNKSWMIFAVIVIVLGIAGYALTKNRPIDKPIESVSSSPTQEPTESPSISPTASASSSASPTNSAISQMKTFTVVGKSFSFSLPKIAVNKGDKVKIIFKNESGTHDWVLDEFNAKTLKIQTGQTAEVEFIADKTGQFEYYCSVGNHRAQGMKGTLTVN